MKKKVFKLMLSSFLLITTTVFLTSGSLAQEKRDVSDFSKVSISIAAKVHLSQGDKESLTLEGDEETLEKIETTISDNTLKIKYKKPLFFGRNKDVTIHITAKQIEEINLAGSSELKAETNISSPRMRFVISGSGKINIDDLSTEDIEAVISGSGNIMVDGKSQIKSTQLSISGSGDYIAQDLKSENLEAKISGSGKCKIFATENLKVHVSGSGKVYYNGKPVVNAKISGSGNVEKL
ncbi:MAG: head GIN domain-containing protein [Bacteroidales bacterium]